METKDVCCLAHDLAKQKIQNHKNMLPASPRLVPVPSRCMYTYFLVSLPSQLVNVIHVYILHSSHVSQF